MRATQKAFISIRKEANEPLPKYNEETGQLERVSKPAPAKKAGGFELNLPAVQKKSD